jgi:oligoribonuclease NrnB/cAMP/cGMP phosphodiesterase (DHH superfamily)
MAVHHYFELNKIEKDISYHGLYYDQPITFMEKLVGKNVLIVDFSFRMPIFNNLIKICKNVLVIDHHKTAQENLSTVASKHKIFDMNHSGATLTWSYLFGTAYDKMPLFIQLIEDRDIWTKKLPGVDELSQYLFTVELDPKSWTRFLNQDILDQAILEGRLIKKISDDLVEKMTRRASIKFQKIGTMGYYFIIYCQCGISSLVSDLGNRLIQLYPHVDFAAVYSLSESQTKFSLRSSNTQADVSNIAKYFNGGGHRNAAGVVFYHSTIQLPCICLGEYGLFKTMSTMEKNNDIIYLYSAQKQLEMAKYLLQKDLTAACAIVYSYNKDKSILFSVATNKPLSFVTNLCKRTGSDNANEKYFLSGDLVLSKENIQQYALVQQKEDFR